MHCGGEAPVQPGIQDSMPSDERETPGSDEQSEDEASTDIAGATQPRDPETGKFLPKDERPAGRATGEPDSTSSVAEARTEPATDTETTAPAPPVESTVAVAERGQTTVPRPHSAAARPVFVTNPGGYARPPTVYLPSLPWLRLAARPPQHRTVSRPS